MTFEDGLIEFSLQRRGWHDHGGKKARQPEVTPPEFLFLTGSGGESGEATRRVPILRIDG